MRNIISPYQNPKIVCIGSNRMNQFIKHVLIVDDDETTRIILEEYFHRMNYTCSHAEEPLSALDILQDLSFSLIITDYNMPHMNGIDFIKAVKKINPFQNFIIMSGFGETIKYQDMIDAGASDYLKKPIEMSEFISRILRIEREQEILKELDETNQKLEMVLQNVNTFTEDVIESQEDLSNVFQYITDALIVVDTSCTILKVNESFHSLFGTINTPIEGIKCYDLMSSPYCNTDNCPSKQILNGIDKIETIIEYETKDKTKIPCNITTIPYLGKDGALKGMIKIIKDLRDEEVQRDKGVVLSMLANSAKAGKQKALELNRIYQKMDQYYSEMRQTEQKLRESEKELRLLNNISKILLTTSDNTMFDKVLKLILKKLDSPYGLFGSINANHELIIPTQNIIMKEKCQNNDHSIHKIIQAFQTAISQKQIICHNTPQIVPEGHIKIQSMIVTPIVSNDEVIGVFIVANKPNGYSKNDQIVLKTIAKFISPVLQARMQKQIEENERIQAEKALTMSREYREKIIQSMLDALIVVDIQGNIKTINPAALQLFGYEEQEIIGQSISLIIHSEPNVAYHQVGSLPNVLHKLSKEENVTDYELICCDKTNNSIPVSFSGRIMTDETQKIIAFLCILRDIRGLQETTARLVEAEKLAALGELTGGIGHELKQPMNVIKITTQSLLRDIQYDRLEKELLAEDLTQITTQVNKMASIIDHMRIFTRRSHEMEKEPVDLNHLIEETFQFFHQQMMAHHIDLTMSLAPDMPMVFVDPIRIEEVIVNLISNARKALEKSFTSEKHINIKTYSQISPKTNIEVVIMDVEDNGEGIPEHLSDKLFEQFFTTRLPGEGMGLGLSITRKIIEDHNGSITFKNREEGGALFRVTLPVYSDDLI